MPSIGLVVSRYNEDVTWLNEFTEKHDNLNVYLYNKKPEPIIGVYGPYLYEFRPNVGNEAETYLTHMIRNHNNPKDAVTLYVQGNPWDHMHREQMHRIIENGVESFEWLAFHHLPCEAMKNGCHHPELKFQEFYNDIFGKNIPDYFSFGVGGQFAVNSEVVNATPLDRLYQVRDLVLDKYADNWPWCFLERTWDQVIKNP